MRVVCECQRGIYVGRVDESGDKCSETHFQDGPDKISKDPVLAAGDELPVFECVRLVAVGWKVAELGRKYREDALPAVVRIKVVVAGDEIHAVFYPLVARNVRNLVAHEASAATHTEQRHLTKATNKPITQAQRELVFGEGTSGIARRCERALMHTHPSCLYESRHRRANERGQVQGNVAPFTNAVGRSVARLLVLVTNNVRATDFCGTGLIKFRCGRANIDLLAVEAVH